MLVSFLLRVSTEEQAEHGNIETQRQFAENYARLYNLDVYDFYADEGISGSTPLAERPAASRMLADARAKKFDALYVYRADRLVRCPRSAPPAGDAGG
jgi:site-specific DNA recombinase